MEANQSKSIVQYVEVDQDHSGQRIDNYLINILKGVPKSLIYRILRKGEVRVNKKRIKPDYRVNPGDLIRIPPVQVPTKAEVTKPSKRLQTILLERILYEDDYLMIINKPADLAVHGGSGVHVGLIEALREMMPKTKVLELAHRLDKGTSGCLIVAKKRSTLQELHEIFRSGKISKIYTAFTMGHWSRSMNKVDLPLRKNILASGERIVRVNADGKSALSEFHVKQRYSTAELVEVVLHTGRTHQIRVHAQSSGHPIAGDEKYGDKAFNRMMKQKGLHRLFLHAGKLSFYLGSQNKHIRVEAPLDPDLEDFLSHLDN